MAQRDEIIRRTVYVSDIDHQFSSRQCISMNIASYEEGAQAALNPAGTMLGFYPVKMLPSKTDIAPVNQHFCQGMKMNVKCVQELSTVQTLTRRLLKLMLNFFETVCGEVYRLRLLGDYQNSTRMSFVEFVMAASAIAAPNCSGVVLGSLPIRVSPSKTPVRPRAPRLPIN
ncbi:Polyadenylate-binding protein-interacting protein 11 [Hibiscus syriacus]|uniref:Polyadenylate-binding protein-interacting protein 11 n=1 Tax=Hibiscus syriacus TaxID=106335 RepID=A0A6A2YBU9_HIBSY|nr:Polyadenylate-binding protein-interacting protein 11 [Hibiscus syriacus]